MFNPTHIYCITPPMDMRKGVDALCNYLVSIGQVPHNGNAYLFSNVSRNRIKVLCYDGNGVWLCQRRLHQGRFKWASAADSVLLLSVTQWEWLISGVDWQRFDPPMRTNLVY